MKKGALIALTFLILIVLAGGALVFYRSVQAPQPVRPGVIADGEIDPAAWGKVYPLEYDSWLQTAEPRPAGKSKYKKGWDTDQVIYDKLSEFPYLALLYHGWGMGVDYNEPRGHAFMLIDQQEVDQSRTKSGGSCLTCKSPYINKLLAENGQDFLKLPYAEALQKIPEGHRTLGAACIDCHDNRTMDLKLPRWTIQDALKTIGKTNPNRQEMRSLVCAQCHVTYIITRDAQMKATNVIFPWKGSKWGDISVENIIKQIQSDPANLEWTQQVTGFKVGFIRHPEFEFYSRNSVHWQAGVACADCHMPYKRVGSSKISDHNVMSPLKNDLQACRQCHPESSERLREQVLAIQDRTVALMNRAGYATAAAAKLFELAHREQAQGAQFDRQLYTQAKEFYLQALYRVIYLAAENSMGFHNPTEAGRIAGDAVAFAAKAEGLLRQMLTKAGVEVPAAVNLELTRYLNNRGEKKLNFIPGQEIHDPTGIQDLFLPPAAKWFPVSFPGENK
ncbi:MAG: ammonia-forming cytochrome c nitrite reductase subunit c552 [Bacillota bacterium]